MKLNDLKVKHYRAIQEEFSRSSRPDSQIFRSRLKNKEEQLLDLFGGSLSEDVFELTITFLEDNIDDLQPPGVFLGATEDDVERKVYDLKERAELAAGVMFEHAAKQALAKIYPALGHNYFGDYLASDEFQEYVSVNIDRFAIRWIELLGVS